MAESTEFHQDSQRCSRQIVGFTLDPEMAREVKAGAGPKGLSLKKLFEETRQSSNKHGGWKT